MATPTIRKQFARNLKRLRKSAGLTQEEMAEKADIDTRYYQRLESEKANAIKIDTIGKLAKALKTPAWKLLKF